MSPHVPQRLARTLPPPVPVQAAEMVDRWSPQVVASFLTVRMLQLVERAGLTAREDGWRKAAQTYFRTEASKFTLAVLGLSLGPEAGGEHAGLKERSRWLAERLQAFLSGQPTTHWRLRWSRFAAERVATSPVEVVWATFAESGALERLEPALAEGAYVIAAYNATRSAPDKQRPRLLERALLRTLEEHVPPGPEREAARERAWRLLGATYLSTSVRAEAQERFTPPDFLRCQHPGHGLLNVHARMEPSLGEVDLWFQIHHSPVDGVPMQEVLTTLRAEWGESTRVRLPAAGASVRPWVCGRGEGQEQHCALEVLDFRPLLEARARISQALLPERGRPVPLSAFLLWALAHQPAFADKKIVLPVDVPATQAEERTLGVLAIRPSVYFNEDTRAGFLAYLHAFEQRLEGTRGRRSATYSALRAFALSPPFLYEAQRRMAGAATAEGFGSLGVTIIRDAEVFLPPLGDANPDGFLAFARLEQPSEDGGSVGVVGIKGTASQVESYREALRDMLARVDTLGWK